MIKNTLHVNTLFLSWQSNRDRNQRYLVGQLKRLDEGFEFSYLTSSDDFLHAKNQGFLGYPAFPLDKGPFTNDVIVTFMKRLPPRSRRDFKKYLLINHLPETFDGSDFDLITHTGIQLPSDGFDLIPNLEEAEIPFEYFMEVAGTRYHMTFEQVSALELGASVRLKCEDENEFDSNAVAMYVDNLRIGYVNKLMCPTIRALMERDLSCSVVSTSGSEERPLINVMLSVK